MGLNVNVSFNRIMAIGIAWLGGLTYFGARIEGRHGGSPELLALGIVLAGAMPFPLYLHEKGRRDYAGAVQAFMWAAVLTVLIPLSVEIGARLAYPLQDGRLAEIDSSMAINVPAIAAWSNVHAIGRIVSSTYPLLLWILPIALLLPVLAGHDKVASEFVAANMIAAGIGIPLFAFLPAVGPWYGFNASGDPSQMAVQTELLALRQSAAYVFQVAGVVCFPSFHVVWAILCARALWSFRWLRWPSFALCLLIALSTLTTGWHYFSDVLAGAFLAAIAILTASRIVSPKPRSRVLIPLAPRSQS